MKYTLCRGGRSSVGRAPDCGSGRRGFESRRSPHYILKPHVKKFCRGVAQLVAHSLWARGVASSSLAAPTIFLHDAVTNLRP